LIKIKKTEDMDFMKRAVKVLHTEWSLGWGGQEIRIINEMEEMRRRGAEMLMACRSGKRIEAAARERGFGVYTFPFRGNADIATLFGIAKLIRREKIDIVNTHSGKDTWVGGLAAKLAGAGFIRTRHLSNPIRTYRLNFINELADFIMTTGEKVKDEMIRDNRIRPERIASVPTGIDERRFDPSLYDKESARKKYGIKKGQKAVGILAVLRGFKRHDIFVEAAEKIAQRDPDTVFLIAGEGSQRHNIERIISEKGMQDRIRMLGHLKEPADFLAALDLFMLTSDASEGVPQSVIQALMMDLPIIATDVGSTKDLYGDGNFIIVKPNDINTMAEKAVEILSDPVGIHSEITGQRREFALKNLTLSGMGERIEKIYEKILSE